MTRDQLPDICIVQEVAAYLRCSVRKVQYLEAAGELPTHRLPSLGRMVRYDGATLRLFGTTTDSQTRAASALRRV